MRKLYLPKYLSWLVFSLSVTIGCHQEPILSASAIPLTCQIYGVENVDEGIRDTTTYSYTAFGHLRESAYRQWVNNFLTISTKQDFTYDDNHFLITQVDQTTTYTSGGGRTQNNKAYSYTYNNGQIQQIKTTDALSGQVIDTKEYIYFDGKLKTYTETEEQKKATWVYTFDQTGELTQLIGPGAMSAVVTNGKITKKTLQGGTIITYEFDSQGQLMKETTTSNTTQTERTYAYDEAPYWNKTQLLLRGIPAPDLGGHTFVHNVERATITSTQNGRVVQNKKFNYQRTYNKAGYPLGYGRDDGARQNIIYANCL
ncbi:hypothetical protein [Spirosoma arcticum]